MAPEIPFTLGFAFDPSFMYVLLILKKRGPSFNIGKWNGIGGKIEQGEGIRQCMRREFREETGLDIDEMRWYGFHQETHHARAEQTLNPRLHCLTTMLTEEEFSTAQSTTDEVIAPYCLLDINMLDMIGVYNLTYLVLMAQTWHRFPEHRWLEG